MSLWRAHVITLFPEIFPGPLAASLPGKARQAGIWDLSVHPLRDSATDKHRTVDDTPYGGGAGMVLKPDVVDAALGTLPVEARKIYLSPRGAPLRQDMLHELAREKTVALLCGRYEGVDQRVIDKHALEEISLGDFVLAGGEVAALALIEGVVRLLPGAIGNDETHAEESFADGLLEYPHYTRPAIWQERAVPDILLNGDHARIKAWRREQVEALTKSRRPDLWARYKGG